MPRLALIRGTLAFASIMGLREDNNLVGQQYALLGTVSPSRLPSPLNAD